MCPPSGLSGFNDSIILALQVVRVAPENNLSLSMKRQRSFSTMKKTLFSSLVWLYSLLLLAGCSDTPYTGSMLSPGDIDRYIVRAADGSICLADASDAVCFTLIPQGTDTLNAPIIHVYRRKLIYVFYYDEHPIVRVERFVDTTGIRQALSDTNRGAGSSRDDPLGPGNVNADADEINTRETDDLFSGNDGWFIRIHYPDGRDLPRGISQLEDSGLHITINGKPISSKDIESFSQFTGPRGTGVQFFYPNIFENTSRLTVKVTGLISDKDTVTFQIDPPTEDHSAYISE